MKRFPMLFVAALLGVVVSVPAQFQNSGRSSKARRGAPVATQQSPRGQASNRSTRSVGSTRSVRAIGSARSNRANRPVQSSRAVRNHPSRSLRGSRSVRPVVSNGRRVGRSVGAAVGRAIGRAVVGRHGRSHGHWTTRCERVLIPGYWDIQHQPAAFGWVYDSCGRRQWGVIEPACDQRVWIPARYENQSRRVWVPARY